MNLKHILPGILLSGATLVLCKSVSADILCAKTSSEKPRAGKVSFETELIATPGATCANGYEQRLGAVFLPLGWSGITIASEIDYQLPATSGCVAKDLSIEATSILSGTVTFRKNSTDTSMSCSYKPGTNGCTATGTVPLVPGDLVSILFSVSLQNSKSKRIALVWSCE